MADIVKFRGFLTTPARRRTFYCYTAKLFLQDQAMFLVLVEAYRASRSKRQALLLTDMFIDGNIPDILAEGGYVTKVNIEKALATTMSAANNAAVNAVGKTFADKQKLAGGGASGFFGALKAKLSDTKLPEDLFAAAQGQVCVMLSEHGFDGVSRNLNLVYNPDGTYMPPATFSGAQIAALKQILKTGGFDPDDLGIY